jgi:hypothetical protein
MQETVPVWQSSGVWYGSCSRVRPRATQMAVTGRGKMNVGTFVVLGFVGTAALVTACSASTEDVDVRPAAGTLDPMAKKSSPQLNLSHIECLDDGTVNAHFVLLFAGDAYPGTLSGTYLDDGVLTSFGPIEPTKTTGNVWHYNVSLTSGAIDIVSASVGSTTLHNPGEYAGNYFCGEDDPQCPVTVEAHSFCKPVGGKKGTSPATECGWLGLEYTSAKDESGGSIASETAYVAIVKGGSNGQDGVCAQGESSYNVYVNVVAGETELATGNGSGISHVTYCKCPTQ